MDINKFGAGLTAEQEEEIRQYFPQFMFYRRTNNRKESDCYCTACHSRFNAGKLDKTIKHNGVGDCLECSQEVVYKQMDRGRSRYWASRNFALFEARGEDLLIKCVKVYQRFIEDEMEPQFETGEYTRYYLTKGSAIQYLLKWRRNDNGGYIKEYISKKSKPTEPYFSDSPFGDFYGHAHIYTTIGVENIEKTFLKYSLMNIPESIGDHLITYLCRIAEHPNLEYLVHGGFFDVAMNYVRGGSGIYINWRSNDMLKMLRINRTERNFLADGEASVYKSYIDFRKNIYQGRSTEETIRYFETFGRRETWLTSIFQRLENAPYTKKQIMDYISRQFGEYGIANTIIDYKDYLSECIRLGYDLTDKTISMPKDMRKMHERTSKLIRMQENRAKKEQFAESNRKREDMEYMNVNAGLRIILPQSVEEIIEEGKRQRHCVGGYADRHADGVLTILFLRKIAYPDTPFYTMEVNASGKIVQCRGYANNRYEPKPAEITRFEEEYQLYLDHLGAEKSRKHKARRSAQWERK